MLKVATYNICTGHNLARERDMRFSASVLRDIAPDICVLNEVRNGSRDVGGANQAAQMGELLGYNWVFGRAIDLFGGEYGNALVTRLPILKWDVTHIPDRPSADGDYFEHRSVLRCLIETTDGKVTVLATHFGLTQGERLSAGETVARLIDETEGPLLLMGDFNSEPADAALVPVYARLTDVCGGTRDILTYPSDIPTIKIDYIFTRGMAHENVHSIDTQMSDHRPLIADVRPL